MPLRKYYKEGVIYPAVFMIICFTIVSIIVNHDYESEWLTRETVFATDFILAVLYSLIVGLLSISIFLNKYEMIRSKLSLSIITWMFPSFLFNSIVLTYNLNHFFNTDKWLENGNIYIFCLTIPFLIGNAWSFIKFRINFS